MINKDFKFLRLRDREDKVVTMYIDSKQSREWFGKSVYTVEKQIPTKDPVADGTYSFTDGRVLEVKDGKVGLLMSRGEVIIEERMQEFRDEVRQLNENFAALAEAMVAITKAIKNG